MKQKIITSWWCTCILLTLFTSCWPIFNNVYLTAVYALSSVISIILTNIVLIWVNDVDSATRRNNAVIGLMCAIWALICAVIVTFGLFYKIDNNLFTISVLILSAVTPIGIISTKIAIWKPKK